MQGLSLYRKIVFSTAIMIYILPVIVLAALIACSNTDESIIDEDLLDVVWRIDSLQTREGKIVLGLDTIMTIQFNDFNDTTFIPSHTDPAITIQFNEDMTLRAFAACNWCEGNYEIAEKKSISINIISVTAMACVREMFIEYIYINALKNITDYEVDEDQMRLYDKSHQNVINFSIK